MCGALLAVLGWPLNHWPRISTKQLSLSIAVRSTEQKAGPSLDLPTSVL